MSVAQPTSSTPFGNDSRRWQAVVGRNKAADGQFVYSVRTTGVYCRPSCAARLARRENVAFHETPADAERLGFRACKRCEPHAPLTPPHAGEVARACRRIETSEESPDLQTLAHEAGMSASHFHRAFKSLMGLTPKAYAVAHRAKRLRNALNGGAPVTRAIYHAGFQSSGRFYATADQTLGMKPAAFRAGGEGEAIQFVVGECSLGHILVAASQTGVCAIAFGEGRDALVRDLHKQFPSADLVGGDKDFEKVVARVVAFVECPATGLDLPLDVRGTAFQQRVWTALRDIAVGDTRSYAEIARSIGAPRAVRAVAGACAANAIAVAIPCHRVVRSGGALSGYRWGAQRKAKLLAAEQKGVPKRQ